MHHMLGAADTEGRGRAATKAPQVAPASPPEVSGGGSGAATPAPQAAEGLNVHRRSRRRSTAAVREDVAPSPFAFPVHASPNSTLADHRPLSAGTDCDSPVLLGGTTNLLSTLRSENGHTNGFLGASDGPSRRFSSTTPAARSLRGNTVLDGTGTFLAGNSFGAALLPDVLEATARSGTARSRTPSGVQFPTGMTLGANAFAGHSLTIRDLNDSAGGASVDLDLFSSHSGFGRPHSPAPSQGPPPSEGCCGCCGAFERRWRVAVRYPREATSLFVLSGTNPVRRACFAVAHSAIFSAVVLACILLDTVLFALDQPRYPLEGTTRTIVAAVDSAVVILFVVEVLAKIVALGLVLHPGAYLRSGWNALDAGIVLVSAVAEVGAVAATNTPAFKLLQLVRVLRPARFLAAIPQLRRQVEGIIAALPKVFDNILLLAFVMLLFTVTAVNLWAGVLNNRCYVEAVAAPLTGPNSPYANISFPALIANDRGQLCGGMRTCGEYNLTDGFGRPIAVRCAEHRDKFFERYMNYNNIGTGFLLLLKVVVLDDWSEDMVRVMQASTKLAPLFFIALSLTASFFCLSLFLAILTNAYTATDPGPESSYDDLLSETDETATTITMARSLSLRRTDAIEERYRREQLFGIRTVAAQTALGLEDPVEFFCVRVPDAVAMAPPSVQALAGAPPQPQPPVALSVPRLNPFGATSRRPSIAAKTPSVGSGLVRHPRSRQVSIVADVSAAFPPPLVTELTAALPANASMEESPPARRSVDAPVPKGRLWLWCSAAVARFYVFAAWLAPYERTMGTTDEIREEDVLEPRAAWRERAGAAVESDTVCTVMVFFTLLNIVVVSIDYHNIPDPFEDALFYLRSICAVVFALHIALKAVAFGFRRTFRRWWNVLDLVVVCISIPDMFFRGSRTYSLLAIVRAMRTIRVIRLLQGLTTFRAIARTIAEVWVPVALLLLLYFTFLYMYAVLGMQLFGLRYEQDTGQYPAPPDNFGSFLESFLLCFLVVRGESWTTRMRFAMAPGTGHEIAGVIFFVSLYCIGNFVLMNLFIAIVFDKMVEKMEELDGEQELLPILMLPELGIGEIASAATPQFPPALLPLHAAAGSDQPFEPVPQGVPLALPLGPVDTSATSIAAIVGYRRELLAGTTSSWSGVRPREREAEMAQQRFDSGAPQEAHRGSTVGEPAQPIFLDAVLRRKAADSRWSRIVAYLTHVRPLYVVEESLFLFSTTAAPRRLAVTIAGATLFEMLISATIVASVVLSFFESARNDDATNRLLNAANVAITCVFFAEMGIKVVAFGLVLPRPLATDDEMRAEISYYTDPARRLARRLRIWRSLAPTATSLPSWLPMTAARTSSTVDVTGTSTGTMDPPSELGRVTNQPSHNSLPHDSLRVAGDSLTGTVPTVSPPDGAALAPQTSITTAASPAAVFGDPLSDAHIPRGFPRHEPAYLRDPWNAIDVLINVLSIVGVFVPIFKLSRSLRAIRLITRFEGIRVVLTAMLQSTPQVMQGIAFGAVIFFIAAVMGVQLFKGQLYACNDPAARSQAQCTGTFNTTIQGPLLATTAEVPARWTRNILHFDHLGASLLSVFAVAVGDGWAPIMYAAMNTTSDPALGTASTNGRPYVALYFVGVVIFCNFFAFNMIMGILITYYSKMKKFNDGSAFLTADQRIYVKATSTIRAVAFRHELQALDRPVSARIDRILLAQTFSDLFAAIKGSSAATPKPAAVLPNSILAPPSGAARPSVFSRSALANSGSRDHSPPRNPFKGRALSPEDAAFSPTKDHPVLTATFLADPVEKPAKKVRKLKFSKIPASGKKANRTPNELPAPPLEPGAAPQPVYVEDPDAMSIADAAVWWVVLANAAFICASHVDMESWENTMIRAANAAGLTVLTLELCLKMVAYGPSQFLSLMWPRVDLFIVVAGFAEYVFEGQVGLRAISFLPVPRMLRLLRRPRIERILSVTLRSIDSFVNVLAVLVIAFFVFAVSGALLFGRVKRNGSLSEETNFDTVLNAMVLLFQASTTEGWTDIMRACALEPPFCEPELGNCGGQSKSTTFFVLFMITVTYTFLQLFVAVIVEVFVEQVTDQGDTLAAFHEFRRAWVRAFGSNITVVSAEDFVRLVPLLPRTLTGLDQRRLFVCGSGGRGEVMRFVASLDLPIDSTYRLRYRDIVQAMAWRKFGIQSRGGVLSTFISRTITAITSQVFTLAQYEAAVRIQAKWRMYKYLNLRRHAGLLKIPRRGRRKRRSVMLLNATDGLQLGDEDLSGAQTPGAIVGGITPLFGAQPAELFHRSSVFQSMSAAFPDEHGAGSGAGPGGAGDPFGDRLYSGTNRPNGTVEVTTTGPRGRSAARSRRAAREASPAGTVLIPGSYLVAISAAHIVRQSSPMPTPTEAAPSPPHLAPRTSDDQRAHSVFGIPE